VPNPLTTPKAAALAGVLFALLFGVAIVLLHGSMPDDGEDITGPLSSELCSRITLAAHLMPFAAIAFLWFIAVVRDYLGRVEDRFYSTVFLASGLLFLALMLVATAGAVGVVVASKGSDTETGRTMMSFGAGFAASASKTFALRMGAVFMMSLATIWLKTKTMPTWLVVLTYVSAVALLFVSDLSKWVLLAFPIWVLVVSVMILARSHHWVAAAGTAR